MDLKHWGNQSNATKIGGHISVIGILTGREGEVFDLLTPDKTREIAVLFEIGPVESKEMI